MFEKYLQKILKQNLGDFIEEIDSKELSVGLWSGKVDIKNVRLKKNLFQKYGLPLTIVYSSLKGLSLKIPWKSLFTSPLVITIQSVVLLCRFEHDLPSASERFSSVLKLINDTIKQMGQDLVEKGKQKVPESDKGMMERFSYKMLDNLYLSIKNIHIRFESPSTADKLYSFGFSLQALDLYAVNANNEKVFVDRSKLDMSQALFRKKIEMKNFAVYCNWGNQNFISVLVSNQQKKMDEQMMKYILTTQKNKSNSSLNYILVMNVLGIIDEQHTSDITQYEFNFNFEKIVLKVDQDVLKTFVHYYNTLVTLTKKHYEALPKGQLSQVDTFLLRKYCNAFLADFKPRDIWTYKDKDLLQTLINKANQEVLLEKVKFILIHQISIIELSRFLDMKAEDLNKGLLQASQQLTQVQKPNIKIKLTIPQVTLYLMNELGQTLLSLNTKNISLSYYQQLKGKDIMKVIESYVGSIEAINNATYLMASQSQQNSQWVVSRVEIIRDTVNVSCNLSSFFFLYDYNVIFKIIQLVQLQEVAKQQKTAAIEKWQDLQLKVKSKVNKNVQQASSKVNLALSTQQIHLKVRHNTYLWTMKLDAVSLSYKQAMCQLIATDLRLVVDNSKQQTLTLLAPLSFMVSLSPQQQITTSVDPINLLIPQYILPELIKLMQFLTMGSKEQILSTCNKQGQAFVRQGKWCKCLLALKGNHLYCWEIDSGRQVFWMPVISLGQVKKGRLDVLQVSNGKDMHSLTFKEQQQFDEWKLTLQLSMNHKIIKPATTDPITYSLKAHLESIAVVLRHKSQQNNKKTITKVEINKIRIQQKSQQITVKMKNVVMMHDRQEIITTTSERDAVGVVYQTEDKGYLDVSLDRLRINYHPTVFVKIIAFFNEMQVPHPPRKYSTLEESVQIKEQQPFEVRLNMTDFKLTMINKLNSMSLALLKMKKITTTIKMNPLDMIVEGSAQQIVIKDLTQYPRTVYEKGEHDRLKRVILQHSVHPNCLNFVLQIYNQGSPKIVDGVHSKVKIQIDNLKVYYIQEVVLRIIDFISTQLVTSLTLPELFPEYEGQQQRGAGLPVIRELFVQRSSKSLKSKYLHKMGQDFIKQQLYVNKPIALDVTLKNSNIVLINNYQHPVGLVLQVGTITVSNDLQIINRTINSQQIRIPFDHYHIIFSDLTLINQTLHERMVISEQIDKRPTKLEVNIKYFGKEQDIQYVLNEGLALTHQIEVEIELAPIKFELRAVDLHAFSMFLKKNLQHQDGLAFLMNYEYLPDAPPQAIKTTVKASLLQLQLDLPPCQTIQATLADLYFSYKDVKPHSQQKISLRAMAMTYQNQNSSNHICNIWNNRSSASELTLEMKVTVDPKEQSHYLAVSDATLTINPQLIIALNEMILSFPVVSAIPKAYTEPMSRSLIPKPHRNTQIKVHRVFVVLQAGALEPIVISLPNSTFQITSQSLAINVSQIEIFVPNEDHASTVDLHDIKKRTLLLPTSFKTDINNQCIVVDLSKLFFKISLTDLTAISKIFNQLSVTATTLSQMRPQNQMQSHRGSRASKRSFRRLDTKRSVQSADFAHSPVVKTLAKKDKISQPQQLKFQHKTAPSKTKGLSLRESFKQIKQLQEQAQNREISITLKSVELMLIDNYSKSLTPLLYFNCTIELPHLKQAHLSFYAQYFNLRNSCWQPVIEQNTLTINYANKITIQTLDPNNTLQLNVSTNLLENLIKSLNHEQIKNSRMSNQKWVDQDQINSWIIINQLGQNIICCPADEEDISKGVTVPKGESTTIGFLSQELAFKEESQQEEVVVKLVIGDLLTIKRLNINEQGMKKIKIEHSEVTFTIIKNLTMDLSKNIKFLTLASEIVFQNHSDEPITFNDQLTKQSINLPANKSISLPFNCQLSSLYYQSTSDGQPQSLRLLEKKNKLKIDGLNFKVASCQKQLRKIYNFYPFYKIYNYLPYPILLHFKPKEENSLYKSLTLPSFQDKNNHAFLYRSLDELQVSMYIEHFHCTDFVDWSKTFTLTDHLRNSYVIRTQTYREADPMVSIALVTKFIVNNLTDSSLQLFIDQRWLSIKTEGYAMAQNSHLAIAINNRNSESFYLPKHSSQLVIKSNPSELLSYEQSLCIYRHKKEVGEGSAFLNIFEVGYMFLITNQHSCSIVLKQQGAQIGQYQLFEPNKPSSLRWFTQNDKRKPPIFRFTIENSYYEWSCLLNLTVVREWTFVLRNKFDYQKVKYCRMSISKVKEAFHIVFDELEEHEIPYLIINQTQKYNLTIHNLRKMIGSEEESYFCWDDPNTNQSTIDVILTPIKGGSQPIKYQIKVNNRQQDPIKSKDPNLGVQVVNQLNRHVFAFTDEAKDQKDGQMTASLQLKVLTRVALINNSISPAMHILDLNSQMHLSFQIFDNETMTAQLDLSDIQLDNQTHALTYYPVVLTTDMGITMNKAKQMEVQVHAKTIKLNIEQDFANDVMAFLGEVKKSIGEGDKDISSKHSQIKKEQFFISKLVLPKIVVELQVQTRKFSIQTSINLDKPQIMSYPWKQFPYPIKTIAFNILSHLSISPWTFISSFGKGIQKLLTEEQATKGVQGFFQQLLGGATTSISGMLGMIVGHDIQKVEHFIDGVNKGASALGYSLCQIAPSFEGDYSAVNIVKQLGMTVLNIVWKPVTGVLRMTMKISEGIRKTTKFQFVASSKIIKKRLPIVFYQRQQTYRPYNPIHSQLMNTLKKCLPRDMSYFYLNDFILTEYKLKHEKYCLAIGTDQLVLLDAKRQRLLWRVDMQKIRHIDVTNLCTVQVITSDNREGLELDLASEKEVQKVMVLVQKMRKVSTVEI